MTLPATMSGPQALEIAEAMVGEARIQIDTTPFLTDDMRRALHRLCDQAVIEFMLKIIPPEGSS